MDEDLRVFIDINEFDDLNMFQQIPKRYIRDVENPLEFYSDVEFKRRFRFSKNSVTQVLMPIVIPLEKITNRGLPIPPIISLLSTLRFYATGNFQTVCGDLRGIHQSSVCRSVKLVSQLIASRLRYHIKFPADLGQTHVQFYRLANFPSVSGCIDCTHIPIRSPGGNMAEIFRNRKRTFSINVQAICGPNMEIFDIVACWPGREHDSTIFNNSGVKMRFEDGNIQGYLLGDSGYPCLPYLMTSLLNPTTDAENRYNRAQIRTRNIVERMFGLLKRRFPCLSRGLANKTETICAIIVACSVLHNISIEIRDDIPPDIIQIPDNLPLQQLQNQNRIQGTGHAVRRALIQRYFQN